MKEYKIFSEDSHEYTATVTETNKGTKYALKYSENRVWTYPGREVISLTEDGDGNFIFSEKLNKTIDCSDLIQLKLLLNVINLDQKNLSSPYYAIECSKTEKV